MREIVLTQGKVALVDDDDFIIVSPYTWHAARKDDLWYARTRIGKISTFMHRLILGITRGIVVDHINRDGLDNRRANIRACRQAENARNCWGQKETKGVYPYMGKWRAQITVNRKQIYLGTFQHKQEAIEAYDTAAILHHGEFALTNAAVRLRR